jgi:hypothetical protein
MTQEVELQGQRNSQNHEKRNSERWIPSISQWIHPMEVKGVVKVRKNSQKAIDLTKGEISEFRESQGKRNDC